jgi:hypothetical protein
MKEHTTVSEKKLQNTKCEKIINESVFNSIYNDFFSFSYAQIQYKFNHFTTDDGLPTNSIYCITENKNGEIILERTMA